jgi:tetratricopeptide (TPR) repeat protein
MNKIQNKFWILGIYLVLAIITLLVFWQVCRFDFINFDDHTYVTKNLRVLAGLSRDSIAWAFTTTHASNWHPLTWLSHMLDCQLFGPIPGWHHLTNLLFHLANTLLLFTTFKKMTGAIWQSAFVAAAFALHPLHVESVAWVAERKDVLSTFFLMLTISCYVQYAKNPRIFWYLCDLLVFALGLMAKPMLVTLPFILLLLDYWPLNRCESKNGMKVWWSLIREKIPFFALSVISSTITFIVQESTGAVSTVDTNPISDRIVNAVVSYTGYIWKTIWPTNLAIFYPYPKNHLPHWHVITAAALLLAITIFVIYFASRYKYLATGWLWYMGTLVPVIGLVQAGMQASADRYTYVPLIGLFVFAAFGANDIFTRWKYGKVILAVASAAILIIWAVTTSIQLRYWRNNVTLFQHTLQVTKDNYLAHNVLAHSFYMEGKYDESIVQSYEALKIKPGYAVIHNGLGLALLQKGELDKAVAFFQQAIKLRSDYADAYANLGLALYKQGRFKQAIEELTKAISLDPQSVETRVQLVKCLLATNKVSQAVQELKSIADFSGDWTVLNNLAWYLAIYRQADFYDSVEAVRLAQTACRLTNYQHFAPLDTLAVAYAATGRFDEAADAAEKALKLAQAANNKQMVDSIQQHLNLFRNHQPYIEALPKNN